MFSSYEAESGESARIVLHICIARLHLHREPRVLTFITNIIIRQSCVCCKAGRSHRATRLNEGLLALICALATSDRQPCFSTEIRLISLFHSRLKMANRHYANMAPTELTRDFIDRRAATFHGAFGEDSYFNRSTSRYQSTEVL